MWSRASTRSATQWAKAASPRPRSATTSPSSSRSGASSRRSRHSAGSGAVVQVAGEHFGAEPLPVVAAVGEVQVPRLADRVGRGDFVPGGDGEEGEALVLVDHPGGEPLAPPVLAREAGGEAQ